MRPLEVTRAGIIGTVVVLVAATACVRLGLWQLDRRAERLERNAAIAARQQADPVALDRAPVDTAGLTYRRATLTGSLDASRTVVMAGRSRAGQPGVHVFSPIRLADGAVLVNRGWLPAADGATVELAAIPAPDSARYDGILLPFPETGSDRPAPTGFRRTWFRLDGAGIRRQYPYAVAEVYLLATATAMATATGPGDAPPADAPPGDAREPVRLDPPSLDAGPHLSYAIQWFSFATIFLVGWVVLLLKGRSGPRAPTVD